MTESVIKEEYDDDWNYDLLIWVKADKSFEEFEQSLSAIIDPVVIEEQKFQLGAIRCKISIPESTAPKFLGVPAQDYNFLISVQLETCLIWGCFDKQFALSLTIGMRAKFQCHYLVTTDDEYFVMYSGTNLPLYFNPGYPPWRSGELNLFRNRQNKQKDIEVRVD